MEAFGILLFLRHSGCFFDRTLEVSTRNNFLSQGNNSSFSQEQINKQESLKRTGSYLVSGLDYLNLETQ